MKALRTVGGSYNKGDHQREQFALAIAELVETAWTEARA
jgi:hypothetical protein